MDDRSRQRTVRRFGRFTYASWLGLHVQDHLQAVRGKVYVAGCLGRGRGTGHGRFLNGLGLG